MNRGLDNVLTLDTFSTTSSGIEIGDDEFYWVDTVTQEWGWFPKEEIGA